MKVISITSRDEERLCRCYLSSVIYCPMIAAERDGDDCARCPHFCGITHENGFFAAKCSWKPKGTNAMPHECRCAA